MRTLSFSLGAEDYAHLLAIESVDVRRRAPLCRAILARGLTQRPRPAKHRRCVAIHLKFRIASDVFDRIVALAGASRGVALSNAARAIFAAGLRAHLTGKRNAFAKMRRIHVPARGVEVKE